MTSSGSPEPPGSAGSSPDECQHEEAVQIAGDRLRRPGRRIAYLCNECGEAWTITTPIEAKPEAPEEPACRNCGHGQDKHHPTILSCALPGCYCNDPDYTPAEPEARCASCGHAEAEGCGYPPPAQEAAMQELIDLRQEMEADEPCLTQFPEGLCAGTRRHPGDCTPNADDIALPLKVEAPECKYPGGCPLEAGVCPAGTSCAFDVQLKGGPLMPRPEPEAPELCHCGIGTPGECATGPAGCGPNSEDPSPPRRPPYAVAYAVEGGAQYEIALPGDATVRFADGALIITHASAVLALTQARPMES